MHLVCPAPEVKRLSAAVVTRVAVPETVQIGDEIADARAKAL
jgi:hypothetical protein